MDDDDDLAARSVVNGTFGMGTVDGTSAATLPGNTALVANHEDRDVERDATRLSTATRLVGVT